MNTYAIPKGGKIFDFINYGTLFIFTLIVAYPFWHIFVLSFSQPEFANSRGLKFFPPEISFESYKEIFHSSRIINAYIVTIIRTVLGTVLAVIFSAAAAFSLSKDIMPFRKAIHFLFIFAAYFSGGLIPTYILLRSMHITNTIWALVLPELLNCFYILIIQGYMHAIPDSLEESAVIDGANEFVLLFRIIIPLCLPIMAAVALWAGIFHWNDWYLALFYVTDPKYSVLQVVLRQVIVDSNINTLVAMTAGAAKKYTSQSVKAAITMVAIGPVILAYPFAQKYFIQGMYLGSVKG